MNGTVTATAQRTLEQDRLRRLGVPAGARMEWHPSPGGELRAWAARPTGRSDASLGRPADTTPQGAMLEAITAVASSGRGKR